MPGSTAGRRKLLLITSLTSNLGVLAAFKYGNFLIHNFSLAMDALGVPFEPMSWNVVLPVGISFYTFQTLSYTIDVYRQKIEPWHSFLDFALFVSFFPQLVAGPIVRASHFLPQCLTPRRATSREISWGATLLLVGLFQKVILADALMAPIADLVYADAGRAGFLDAWIGTLAFSAQILFDFAGYSTCAIGVALMLGFELPDNFRAPYAARGFSDFWKRWHISLSSWLKDYLYIPLGGNRRGPRRTDVNLMVTMLLGGLWHGAAWRFVIWGALHGLYLLLERHLRNIPRLVRLGGWKGARPLIMLATYAGVCLTWVFFRAETWGDALSLSLGMMGFVTNSAIVIGPANVLLVVGVTIGLLGWHAWLRDSSFEERWQQFPVWLRVGLVGFMAFLLAVTTVDDRAFIYFQF